MFSMLHACNIENMGVAWATLTLKIWEWPGDEANISLLARIPWRPRLMMMSAGVVNQVQLVSPLAVYGALLPHAR
jgi:hypothetical protein